jgi:hypothetical protein
VKGLCDAEAMRLAVQGVSSQTMGHLRKHAGVHFQFLCEAGIILQHLPCGEMEWCGQLMTTWLHCLFVVVGATVVLGSGAAKF